MKNYESLWTVRQKTKMEVLPLYNLWNYEKSYYNMIFSHCRVSLYEEKGKVSTSEDLDLI